MLCLYLLEYFQSPLDDTMNFNRLFRRHRTTIVDVAISRRHDAARCKVSASMYYSQAQIVILMPPKSKFHIASIFANTRHFD
jgi:hypothetical protein